MADPLPSKIARPSVEALASPGLQAVGNSDDGAALEAGPDDLLDEIVCL